MASNWPQLTGTHINYYSLIADIFAKNDVADAHCKVQITKKSERLVGVA